MIITATSLAALTVAYNAAYNTGFAGVKPSWQMIATEIPSTTAETTYAFLGSWPRLKEWLGERQVKNLEASGYSLRNKKFEATVGVKAEDIEDDQAGVYKPMMQEVGRSAAVHPDEIVFECLKNGFAAKCYDGAPFFGNHKVGKETVSNLQAGAGAPWFLLDCSRSLKPLVFQKRRDYRFVSKTDPQKSDTVFNKDQYVYGVDARVNAGYGFWQMAYASKAELTAANLRAAFMDMAELQDDQGKKLGIRPTILVVPPEHEFAARDILFAERNDAGASNTNYKLVELLVTPYAA